MFDTNVPRGDSATQFVSRGDAAVAAMGDRAIRLRRARLEISDADRAGEHRRKPIPFQAKRIAS
jgi:hypothetical protein